MKMEIFNCRLLGTMLRDINGTWVRLHRLYEMVLMGRLICGVYHDTIISHVRDCFENTITTLNLHNYEQSTHRRVLCDCLAF